LLAPIAKSIAEPIAKPVAALPLMPEAVILKNEEKLLEHLLGFLNNRKSPLKLRLFFK
jgi:hypothetical protein